MQRETTTSEARPPVISYATQGAAQAQPLPMWARVLIWASAVVVAAAVLPLLFFKLVGFLVDLYWEPQ